MKNLKNNEIKLTLKEKALFYNELINIVRDLENSIEYYNERIEDGGNKEYYTNEYIAPKQLVLDILMGLEI